MSTIEENKFKHYQQLVAINCLFLSTWLLVIYLLKMEQSSDQQKIIESIEMEDY